MSSAHKRTLRERMRILFHNLRYCTTRLFSYDHEEACRSMLHIGKQIANPIPPYWNKCPVCEHELERTVQQGFIIPFCPRWYMHPAGEPPLPDIERHSDKMPCTMVEQPIGAQLLNYRQECNPDASLMTQEHWAVHLPKKEP